MSNIVKSVIGEMVQPVYGSKVIVPEPTAKVTMPKAPWDK